ncbi:hypothetical protein JCM11251_007393 [Rhodosporidiobolus azoricus]
MHAEGDRDAEAEQPPPPPPPRRSYAAASAQPKASPPPPPVPPKHASLQPQTQAPVQSSSFFAASSPTEGMSRRRSGSGGFRPAGSASGGAKSSAVQWPTGTDGGVVMSEQQSSTGMERATSAVREAVDEDDEQSAPWNGRTWNQQLKAAHNRSSPPQPTTTSPHFDSPVHVEHAPLAPPIHLSDIALPPLHRSSDTAAFFHHLEQQSNSGSWTVPRILAAPGNPEGGLPGLWQHSVWDFPLEGAGPVRDTPAGQKATGNQVYRAMGTWVGTQSEKEEDQAAPSSSVTGTENLAPPIPSADSAASSFSDPPAVPPKSDTPSSASSSSTSTTHRKGYSTVSRAELSTIPRPHPHLYFCHSTFSWALLAPLSPTASDISTFGNAALPSSESEPEVWRAQPVPADEVESFIIEHLSPSLPKPIEPAQPQLLSEDIGRYTHWSPATAGALVALVGSKGNRAVMSPQEWYPAVIRRPLWEALLAERGKDPALGISREEQRLNSVRFIWRALDNLLFVGESRALPIDGKTFQRDMPMDAIAKDIFLGTLGFTVQGSEKPILAPPSVDERTPDGSANRKRLLRAWFEIGCWLEAQALKTAAIATTKIRLGETRIDWKIAKDRLEAAFGGDKLPRVPSSDGWQTVGQPFSLPGVSGKRDPKTGLDLNAEDYGFLGLTPDLADSVVEKVYDLQTKALPYKIPLYLEALTKIAEGRSSVDLQTKIALEKSSGRYSRTELNAAFHELHLPSPYEAPWPSEDQLLAAFDARNTAVEHPARRKVLLEAAKVVGEHTKSEVLLAMVQSVDIPIDEGEGSTALVKAKMDPVRAYAAMGVEESEDDEMILMIYPIRLEDATSDADKAKAREALEVIAEARNSEKLKAFLLEGKKDAPDSWQAGPSIDPNVPVGLTNIANTCYLNSLLQYFFTVRELRETILAYDANAPTPVTGERQPIRVGGRLVSDAEVKRSKRFVTLLQTLYNQLIHSPLAVTPETELAYLALVPSKEEEQFNTSASSDTLAAGPAKGEEITLTDAPAAEEEVKSPGGSTVLGKRKNGAPDATSVSEALSPSPAPATSNSSVGGMEEQLDDMVIDSQQAGTPGVLAESPAPPMDAEMADGEETVKEVPVEADEEQAGGERQPKRGRSLDPSTFTSSTSATADTDAAPSRVVDEWDEQDQSRAKDRTRETGPPSPPGLPPRPLPPMVDDEKKKEERRLEEQVSNYMAFGRQNDVTECMDNVMFQVESALLASSTLPADQGKANLLKRTFYGHQRQTVLFSDPSSVPDPIRTRLEPFSSLLVDVPPASSLSSTALQRDLYDALDSVFEPQQVELEGKLATRRVGLVADDEEGALPTLLQIQLQRVQYDRVAGRVFKSNAHLELPEVLDVGRYVDGGEQGDEDEKRVRTERLRSELGRVRRRLEELTGAGGAEKTDEMRPTGNKQALPLPAPTLLRSTLSHFETLSTLASTPASSFSSLPASLTDLLTSDLARETADEAEALENEVKVLEARVGEIKEEVRGLWESGEGQGGGETKYELCSVFIHRGTALSGHYYIYQRDSRNPDRWLKYNDSLVVSVPKEEVFKATNGDTNPYFLVYVRRDRLDAIESVKREV